MKCQGRFENVSVLIQGIPFTLTFYYLLLIRLELVLGIQWLEELGTVEWDWKAMMMAFQWQN